MKCKIIDAQIFTAQVTNKTIWLFISLRDINNIEGWGEASLQGKETEVCKIKNDIFKIILNQNYTSPYDFKNKLPFSNIIVNEYFQSLMTVKFSILQLTSFEINFTIVIFFA